jgi:glycosyltransferase involved in cell wall biosynthesis
MTDLQDVSCRIRRGPLHRVAIVSHTNCLYGAGRSLLELVLSLRSMGLEVGVALPRGGLLERKLRRYQCHIWNMQLPAWIHKDGMDKSLLPAQHVFAATANQIAKKLQAWGADLLWTNSSITPVGALAAHSLRIPHIWHLRELNGDGYGYQFSCGEEAAAELIRTANRRIAVSRTVKAYYEKLGSGHCDWIYNGIGPEARLETRHASAWSGDVSRLVIVGRVTDVKGHSIAIEALGKLRAAGYPVTLRVVGDGDIASCRKLANGPDTSGGVEFAGFHDVVDEHYRWAHIALSCASIEAMGRSTAEAMSWGLPIAGHCGAGTGELVGDAGAGLLYDGSADHLARVVAALIDDPRTSGSMGKAGQLWARTHFTSERHASRITEIVGALAEDTARTGTKDILSHGHCLFGHNIA